MRCRIIQTALMAILLAFAAPVAAVESDGDEKDAFREAYKAYQEAVEAKDIDATAKAAGAALELGKSVFPDDSPSLAALYVNYGSALSDARSSEEAISPLQEGLERLETLYGKKDERLIDPLLLLADAYSLSYNFRKARKVLRRLRPLVRKSFGVGSVELARVDFLLGQANYMQAKIMPAITYLRDAVEVFMAAPDVPPAETGIALHLLGKAEFTVGALKDAVPHLREALLRLEQILPSDDEIILYTQAHLSFAYSKLGKHDEAAAVSRAIKAGLGDAAAETLENECGASGVVDNCDVSFLPLKRIEPFYPRKAQRESREGWVLIKFTVTNKGRVKNPEVVLSIGGDDFSDAAIRAARKFVYQPRKVKGVPVDTDNVYSRSIFQIASH